ncbi:MAG: Spy/CpxP family protein refolding chaperone [Candidatus Lambdaproteobacteria bacterium]|nr:Spy/CpxP family protein refolding chaperone [Candidatus Lambdaproteobacteria bacterium]
MNQRLSRLLRRVALPVLLIGGLGLGLQSCYRGYGWGHGPRFSGEYMEQRMDWIQQDLAEDLRLRDDQRPAYDALLADVKAFARKRVELHRAGMDQLRTEFDKAQPDVENVKAIAKQHITQRASDEELNVLVDKVAAFYATLDAEQQAEVNRHIRRHLNRSWGPGRW